MRRPFNTPLIEPLESRIAPAAVTLTAYSYNDKYVNAAGQTLLQFFNAGATYTPGSANYAIAQTVGDNPNVYFMKISAGEDLQIYTTGSGKANEVNVVSGTVIAFFTDTAANTPSDQVLGSELTGVSLGNHVSVAIGGAVNGDIVTNYNDATGTLGGIGEAAGHATQLLPNLINSLTVSGNVSGAIIAGANVSSLQAGFVNQILTGHAANGYTFNFEGSDINSSGVTQLSVPVPATGVAGPSLSNVVLGGVNTLTLGVGGATAAGGGISGITIQSGDLVAGTITAGAGGDGILGHTTGGKGGSITNILVQGPPTGAVLSPNALLDFQAGQGGAGYGATGHGGAGGAVSNMYFGYVTASLGAPSTNFLQDDVIVTGGVGGSGGYAGVGGSLTNINILTSTPHGSGSAEIQLIGGTGGNATLSAGGAGGSVKTGVINDVENLAALLPIDPTTNLPYDTSLAGGASAAASPTGTLALIQAGNGGIGATSGGAGGAISGFSLQGYNFSLAAGTGGEGGHSGASGGGISIITVQGSPGSLPGEDYHAESLLVQTGNGGNGLNGSGGNGGALYGLNVNNANFAMGGYDGLQLYTGNGGTATKGSGGAGGSMSQLRVTGVDFLTDTHPTGASGNATIVAGQGGNAEVTNGHGGAGGTVSNFTIVANRLNVTALNGGVGGIGGVNSSTGTGGAGGKVIGVAVRVAEGMDPTAPATASASAGVLYDPNAGFVADGVIVGDFVKNTLNQETSVVTSVTATSLGLQGNIIAAGDPYLVLVPGTNGGDAAAYQGTASDPGGAQDSLIDASASFSNVAVGDVVENVTASQIESAAQGKTVVVTANVTSVAAGVLGLSADIFHADDQYAFTTLGGVAVTPTSILVSNANFVAEGITVGTVLQDVTASQAATLANPTGATVNLTATVTAVTANSITFSNPTSSGVATITFGAVGDLYSFPALAGASIAGGNGGAGTLNGAGGAGGLVSDSSASTGGLVSFIGGTGGGGGINGAAGAGGALITDGAFSAFGSGSLIAGSAGGSGIKAGAGGSVTSAVVEVLQNVTLIGGAGTAGGAGGGISSSGYSGVLQNDGGFNPPAGNVLIQSGAGGSSTTGAGGAGGTIYGVTGFVSSGDGVATDSFYTEFIGGNGGNGTTKAGAGGSVEFIRFFGGGGPGVNFFLNAGDAGDTTLPAGKTGAAGGDVIRVGGGSFASTSGETNFSINPLTDFNHISAGNGGYGSVTGGTGGYVYDVFVNAAIGIRSGAMFGFDVAGFDGATVTGMGGISAGMGGAGGTKTGVAGYVSNIAADAIASIVAGRLHVGQALEPGNLASEVTGVILNGTTAVSLQHNVTYSFGADSTAPISTNATPLVVASALNALPLITSAGGVTVTQGTGGYVVTFVKNGVEPTIVATEPSPSFTTETVQGGFNTSEVQTVQVLAASPFTLTFGTQTTGVLNYTGNTTTDANNVQTALNALSDIPAGGVTVTATAANGSNNPTFVVTFAATGEQALLVPNFQATVANSGSATTQDTQTITLPSNSGIDLTQIDTANFVGSIYNPLRQNATTFSYTQLVSGTGFQFGDAPIDGLVAALNLTSYKNFVPQAYVTEDANGNAFLINNLNG